MDLERGFSCELSLKASLGFRLPGTMLSGGVMVSGVIVAVMSSLGVGVFVSVVVVLSVVFSVNMSGPMLSEF